MSDEREQGYIEGRRRTALNLLQHALKELAGFDIEEDGLKIRVAQLTAERQETIARLRGLDLNNDWPDSLHLADVIDKYIEPAIEKLR